MDNDHSAGIKPKTEYAIRALQVKFRSFVDEFKLAVDADAGPELQTLRQFTSYLHKNRHGYSSIGRVGMGRQFINQAKYMLPKYVFPRVYPNWQGLSEVELEAKCYPVMKAIAGRWEKLTGADGDACSNGSGTPLAKVRWTDRFYYLAQDWCMSNLEGARLVTEMAVMGFVRATCVRSGSMGKDQTDKMHGSHWMARNVLSVSDFTWSVDGMHLEETGEVDAIRGEVHINRTKRHYFESYGYLMSFTADQLEVVRRASTWVGAMLLCRAVSLVQYDGMSPQGIAHAFEQRRRDGHRAGMPLGAKITADEAVERWLAGERGYIPEMMAQPLFVKLKSIHAIY